MGRNRDWTIDLKREGQGGEDKISYLFLDKSLCIIGDKKSWTTPLVEGKPSV